MPESNKKPIQLPESGYQAWAEFQAEAEEHFAKNARLNEIPSHRSAWRPGAREEQLDLFE